VRLFCATLTPEAKKATALRHSLRHSNEALKQFNKPLAHKKKKKKQDIAGLGEGEGETE
jgi:hypothetical protein